MAMRSQRAGRDGPHAQKLHAPESLRIFVVRPMRMKFYVRADRDKFLVIYPWLLYNSNIFTEEAG